MALANGCLFAVDPSDKVVSARLRRKGSYGLDTIEHLRPLLGSDCRLLVVGAHVGALAIPLSKSCREVVALEPNPHTYQLLTLNVALNNASNVKTFRVAANDRDTTLPFLLSRENSGGSKRVPKIRDARYYADNPGQVLVQGVRLDEFFDDRNFDVIVMDIEGSEFFALRGMQETLSTCHTLVIEFLPHHLRNVSGVSVRKLLELIEPHFSQMTIPSRGLGVRVSKFEQELQGMYELGHGDEGLIFERR